MRELPAEEARRLRVQLEAERARAADDAEPAHPHAGLRPLAFRDRIERDARRSQERLRAVRSGRGERRAARVGRSLRTSVAARVRGVGRHSRTVGCYRRIERGCKDRSDGVVGDLQSPDVPGGAGERCKEAQAERGAAHLAPGPGPQAVARRELTHTAGG